MDFSLIHENVGIPTGIPHYWGGQDSGTTSPTKSDELELDFMSFHFQIRFVKPKSI